MIKKSKYALVAELAVQKAANGTHPVLAWETAAFNIFPDSESSRKKGCPKSTFLGLAEAGEILGVMPGKYTRSEDNKRYALIALKLLRQHNSYAEDPKRLWEKVMEVEGGEKASNSQMEVVVALWQSRKFACQVGK